jgi:aspartate dehydrogenase
MDVLLIGSGSIGRVLLDNIELMPEIEKVYVFDIMEDMSRALEYDFEKAVFTDDPFSSMEKSALVIEAASHQAVREYGPRALDMGKDLMIMSVGALGDDELRKELVSKASYKKGRIYAPSGAVFGTSGLSAASMAKLNEVVLETTKPPKGLHNVPYLLEKGIDVDAIEEKTLVFEGSAKDAARAFPKNVNVSATLSLAGIGFERTKVKVYVDPKIERNTHVVHIKGDFGEAFCRVENVPSSNPGTSYLAALSAVSTLKKIVSGIWIGV